MNKLGSKVSSILQITSGYRSPRYLHQSLAARSAGIEILRLSGYLPAQVRFKMENGTEQISFVRDYDILYLKHTTNSSAIEHMNQIMSARSHDKYSINALERKRFDISSYYFKLFKEEAVTENEYVIPCSTEEEGHKRTLISCKGNTLLSLTKKGYPVPDFVFLNSKAYSLPDGDRYEQMIKAVKNMEILTGQQFGSGNAPLLMAMRCAMPIYIPGFMPTYLNVGVVKGNHNFIRMQYGDEVASRIILNNLKTILFALHPKFVENHEIYRPDLSFARNLYVSQQFSEAIEDHDPELLIDPYHQAFFFLRKAYENYSNNSTLLHSLMKNRDFYPTMIFQKMICSAQDDSYAGVFYSRNIREGRSKHILTVAQAFGEEIMTGGTLKPQETFFTDRNQIRDSFPAVYHICPTLTELENDNASPVTIEFASEKGEFAMLQLNESILDGFGALRSAMDLYRSGNISGKRVTELIKPYHRKMLESSDVTFKKTVDELPIFCRGKSVLPISAVSGKLYFSAKDARQAKERGETVILVMNKFTAEDIDIMNLVDGLACIADFAIHVATISQDRGVPTLLALGKNGTHISQIGEKTYLVGADGSAIKEGRMITISSLHQLILTGKAKHLEGKFMKFVRGESVPIDDNERDFYEELKKDYLEYLEITDSLVIEDFDGLANKFLKIEEEASPQEAIKLVNNWFDLNKGRFFEDAFTNTIGKHALRRRIFNFLTVDKRAEYFKEALQRFKNEAPGAKSGSYTMGSFTQPHMNRSNIPAQEYGKIIDFFINTGQEHLVFKLSVKEQDIEGRDIPCDLKNILKEARKGQPDEFWKHFSEDEIERIEKEKAEYIYYQQISGTLPWPDDK